MKSKAGFICLTILLLCLSISCVSASDNGTANAVVGQPSSNVNPDGFEINHYYTPEHVEKNELVTIVLNVTNKGQIDYHNLSFDYNLPQGLNLIIGPSEYVNGTWTIDTLYAGESNSLMLVCEVTTSNTTLTPTASYDNKTVSSIDIVVEPSADVAIEEGRVLENGLLYWFIHVVNNGPDDALNTTVFNLPPYMSYEADKGDVAGNQWNVGNLKNGTDALLMLVCEPFSKYSFNFLVLSDIFDPVMANNNVSGYVSYHNSTNNTSVKVIDANATGNPIALLMFALALIPLTKFRRAKK